jgi:hypothetical protein
MGNQKQAGIALDPAAVQPIVDGLLCRAPSSSRVFNLVDAAVTAAINPPVFVYCHLWGAAERTAFWRGFLGRVDEFAAEFQGYFDWFKCAFLFGEKDGDFANAWESFGSGIADLATLGWKVVVVTSGPPLSFHPRRNEYAEELKKIGLQITKDFVETYQKAYAAGGIPQCAGRIFADLLRLAFEILATKGAGKVAASAGKLAASGKIATVLEKLPGPLKKLPQLLSKPPKREVLIKYLHHSEDVALHGRGILYDLKPGEFLVRVEGKFDTHGGSWFNGPFKSAKEAKEYADYLAGLGKEGIRQESALPKAWVNKIKHKDGSTSIVLSRGNKVEVIRIYEVKHPTPAISSVVQKQEEGAALVKAGTVDPVKAGKAREFRAGQGQQLSVPVKKVKDIHGIDLVKRHDWLEVLITKP